MYSPILLTIKCVQKEFITVHRLAGSQTNSKSQSMAQTLQYCKKQTSGGGLHELGKGSVRAAIASEGYLSDDEFRLHDMHVHDQVFMTKNAEHVEEISMKQ